MPLNKETKSNQMNSWINTMTYSVMQIRIQLELTNQNTVRINQSEYS